MLDEQIKVLQKHEVGIKYIDQGSRLLNGPNYFHAIFYSACIENT